MGARAILAGILAAFVLLCVGFNLLTPLYEGPDEREHVEYVMFVRETWSIPELPHPIFEAVQPPAYYFLQAGAVTVLGLQAPPSGTENPEVGPEDPLFFEHPASERDRPLSGGVGTVRALRAVSTLLGVLTLLLVHATARTLFPGRETLALVVTGTAAFVPQFVAVHALVNNDVLAVLAGALLLFAVARLMVEGEERSPLRYAALAGAALGLGLLAKGYAMASIPVPFIALLLARLGRRDLIRGAAVAAGVALLLSGWLFVRNVSLYGEVWPDRVARQHLAQELPQSIVERSPFDPVFRDIFWRELRDSYWYRGGFGQVQAPAPVYLVLDLLTIALLAGAVGGVFVPARARLGPTQMRILAVFAAAIVLQLAGIVYYNLSIQQFQGRWLFSVQPAIAAWMVVGLRSLLPGRIPDRLLAALPVALVALTVYMLFGVAAPAFAPAA
jgi:4-amino-4-deoxy-L-arabinose transferase-like glycosyltransferase